MGRRIRTAVGVIALLTCAAACSGDEPAATPSPDAGIATTLTDFKIKAAETEAAAGSVTFDLTNDGPSDHSFFLVHTDLAEDQLPVTDHVVEIGDLEVAATVDEIPFGSEDRITVDLEPGEYVMFCNFTGHYESDMHAAFSVT